jgi:RNA polymerase sigma-70 factor, ECF subfamily
MDSEGIAATPLTAERTAERYGHMAIEKRERSEALFAEMMSHHAAIFHLCLGFCRNGAEAEDLTNDIYLKALEKMASLRDEEKLKVWLFRIARNICLNHVRRARFLQLFWQKHPPAEAGEGNPEIDQQRQERIRLLKDAVLRLPRRQREVIILREYSGLSYREIAAMLRINEGTVMSTLNSARKRLTQSIQGDNPHGE